MDCAVISTPYNHVSFKRRKNTWYTIADGNWSDRNIWMSNSFRKYNYPQAGDDVYVNHNVTANVVSTVTNLRVSGVLKIINNVTIFVLGDLEAVGTLDLSSVSSTGGLILYGVNTNINNLISGGTVVYNSSLDCQISNNSYGSFTIDGGGNKYLTANGNVSGNLLLYTVLDLKGFGLFVGGNVTASSNKYPSFGIVKNESGGSVIFAGNLVFAGAILSIQSANVEFRSGFDFYNGTYNLTGCTVIFNTNNQSGNVRQGPISFGNVFVSNVTFTNSAQPGSFIINGQLNGTTPTSKWINQGRIYFNTALLPMSTGIFDYLSYSTSEVGYIMDGDYVLPYTSYQCLYISGAGVKTFSGLPSIANSLNVAQGATLDFQSYPVIIGGPVTITGTLTGISTTAATFIGLLTITGTISLTNSTFECRGGITGGSVSALILNYNIEFTTNNQTIDGNTINLGSTFTFNGTILISGSISVLAGTHLPTFTAMYFKNSLNGNNPSATFINKLSGSGTNKGLHYAGATQPMATGVLDCSTYANTFNYDLAGDQEVKGTTYSTLILAGSGVKKLMGNVVVTVSYQLTGTASIDLNGFTLTTP